MMTITGVRIFIRRSITEAYARESLSAFAVANVLGVISPKMRIAIVRIPVTIPTAPFPNILMARAVARAAEKLFTRLLPIRMNNGSTLIPFGTKRLKPDTVHRGERRFGRGKECRKHYEEQ